MEGQADASLCYNRPLNLGCFISLYSDFLDLDDFTHLKDTQGHEGRY